MNPVQMKTRRGLNTLGKLLREWTKDKDSRPKEGTQANDRSFVLTRAVFEAAMREAGAIEGTDYDLRGDMDFVELLDRAPDRVTFVLPEMDALETIEEMQVELPRLYLHARTHHGVEDIDGFGDEDVTGQDVNAAANYTVKFDKDVDPWEVFLDAVLANYCCSQCK